jgi:hypothetical protein
MSGIAHVVARVGADDPHTLAVLALADAMRNGRRAPVFSADGAGRADGVEPLTRLKGGAEAVVVYHQRGAAPALVSRLIAAANRVAVVHEGAHPDPLALRDLQMLAGAGAVGLATSEAGLARLDALGFERVHRVPPVVARSRLQSITGFAPTIHHLDVTLHGPLLASVSDIASAASSARVVQAYHVLRTYLVRAAHLVIAVPESPETSDAAVETVQREIWGLRLSEAWVQRLGNTGERAALTRRAAVFVTADAATSDVGSALAAMAEGVPVVAPADASAVEALGDGALVLPADAGAPMIAEAVTSLLDDEARRSALAAAGVRAAERFAPELGAPIWLAALAT